MAVIRSATAVLIYNVTIKIEEDIHDDWKKWMLKQHIPDVINTGLFFKYKFCRLLNDPDPGGITYCIQYFCLNKSKLDKYLKEAAPALQKEHEERYKDKYVAFRTFLKIEDSAIFHGN